MYKYPDYHIVTSLFPSPTLNKVHLGSNITKPGLIRSNALASVPVLLRIICKCKSLFTVPSACFSKLTFSDQSRLRCNVRCSQSSKRDEHRPDNHHRKPGDRWHVNHGISTWNIHRRGIHCWPSNHATQRWRNGIRPNSCSERSHSIDR